MSGQYRGNAYSSTRGRYGWASNAGSASPSGQAAQAGASPYSHASNFNKSPRVYRTGSANSFVHSPPASGPSWGGWGASGGESGNRGPHANRRGRHDLGYGDGASDQILPSPNSARFTPQGTASRSDVGFGLRRKAMVAPEYREERTPRGGRGDRDGVGGNMSHQRGHRAFSPASSLGGPPPCGAAPAPPAG